MAKIAITINPTIVKNGGPITSDVYKSHATDLWTKGSLLKLSSGLLVPAIDTKGGAATLDTDDTGTSGARLFIALEDHLTEGSVYCSVQELRDNSIIEMQTCASTNDVTTVSKGVSYAAYQLRHNTSVEGSGLFALDADVTTKPVFNVIDVQTNYEPFNPDGSAVYAKALVKVLAGILA